MSFSTGFMNFIRRLAGRPDAWARICGSDRYPDISGRVFFYQMPCGVLVAAQVSGLPQSGRDCENGIFAFHIHAGARCSGDAADPFADALGHYNPQDCPHPYHAGDLPPLFGNRGCAFQAVYTDRFSVCELIGKTVIIHRSADDFSSQPGGNAGERIACGRIELCG